MENKERRTRMSNTGWVTQQNKSGGTEGSGGAGSAAQMRMADSRKGGKRTQPTENHRRVFVGGWYFCKVKAPMGPWGGGV